VYGLYNTFDTLGRRRQRLLRRRDPTTAATDVGGATLPPASAGGRRRLWHDPTTAAAGVGGVTLPPASTAARGGGQGRPGRTRTDGCPEGAPRAASAVPIIKHPCNPKFVLCCIPIAIQLQAGFETVRHMPGICLAYAGICLAYAWSITFLWIPDGYRTSINL
jgi:hypothetical protein